MPVDEPGRQPANLQLGALRGTVIALEQRLEEARGKLALAEELERRLLSYLEGPGLLEDTPITSSPARSAVMQVATQVILAAEQEAAGLLSATAWQDEDARERALSSNVVSAIRDQLRELEATEGQLLMLGTQALRASDDRPPVVPVHITAGRLQRSARTRSPWQRNSARSDGAGGASA